MIYLIEQLMVFLVVAFGAGMLVGWVTSKPENDEKQ